MSKKSKEKATKKKAVKKTARGATSAKRSASQPSAAKAKKNATRAKRGGNGAKRRVSALDAAATVLKKAGKPMRSRELIAAMAEQGLWKSPAGKTPHATLYAAILREIQKAVEAGRVTRFRKVDRGQFAFNG